MVNCLHLLVHTSSDRLEMTSHIENIDSSSFEENSLIEPVSPLKLTGYINNVLQTILEDPEGNVVDTASSPTKHTPSAFKVCSSFASDPAPLVLFILKELNTSVVLNDSGKLNDDS